MRVDVRVRLSIMMFLQYFVWGAWFVTMGTFLNETLKFEGGQIGWAYSALPIAAVISPFFVGMIADRFFSTERILAALHLAGAGLLYYASKQTTFSTMFPVLFFYALCYMPTLALTNSLSFHQMRDPALEFPGVRVLGTIGWIAAGVFIGLLRIDGKSVEATHYPMIIASVVQVVYAIYCLALPHTPPKKTGAITVNEILGLDALELMKDRSFAVFVLGSFLVCIPLQFYYTFTNQFLNAIHVPDPAFKMTFGQMSEIFFMLVMPFFLIRLGVKWMLLIGMLAWATRYVLFAQSSEWNAMLFVGLALHGVCYDFFFVTGQIYVDHKAPERIRGAAQGFIALVTLGVGGWVGSILCGYVLDFFAIRGADGVAASYDWKSFWYVPAVGAAVVMVLFGLLFNERGAISKREVDVVTHTAEGAEPQVG
jgi:nucleoside transporter